MKIVMISLYFVLSAKLAHASSCSKLGGMTLDDFAFTIDESFRINARPLNKSLRREVVINVQQVRFSKSRSRLHIKVQNLHRQDCAQIIVSIDETKLCYDSGRPGERPPKIEPWRFITCPGSANCHLESYGEHLNVVSLNANVNQAKLRRARICGSTTLLGNVTVIDSVLGEGNYL